MAVLFLILLDQICPKWIELDQIGSKKIKMDRVDYLVQIRSNWSKLDQLRLTWFKSVQIRSNQINLGQFGIRFSRMTLSTCPFRINWPDAKWQDFCTTSKIDPIIFLPCQEFYSTSEFKFWRSLCCYD